MLRTKLGLSFSTFVIRTGLYGALNNLYNNLPPLTDEVFENASSEV